MDADTDDTNDPMCGKPWTQHSRIGECPRDADDRRSLCWVGVVLAVLVALAIAAVVADHLT